MNTQPTPVDVPEELERHLQTLRFRQMAINRQPVELARNKVVDEEALGNVVALEAARAVLAERLRSHREYDDLGVDIAALEARLEAARMRVRIERATQADEALTAARREYEQAQLQTGRAFRRFLNAARRSSNTPGAAIAKPDLRLHLPSLTPLSWNGSTGEIMQQTTLPFEGD